jgi:hypothetical protein
MLVHVVCFKYSSKVAEAVRTDHRDRLRALATCGIAGIADLKVGADTVRSGRSYDTALIVTFADRAAHDAYQQDPRHVPVAKFGAGLCDSVVTVDFEVGP